MGCPGGRGGQTLAEREHGWMVAQLKDGVDSATTFLLKRLELVEVPRVDDERLLADCRGAQTERKPNVGVVQVVR